MPRTNVLLIKRMKMRNKMKDDEIRNMEQKCQQINHIEIKRVN